MGQPVVHVQVTGQDADKLRKFYSDLFSWEFGEPMPPEMGSYATTDPASSGIGAGVGGTMDGKPRVSFFVEVPDLQAALDKAVAMGGSVVMAPMDMPGIVSLAEFADPEGNVIGLVKEGSMG